jgi:hypothetical protein
MSLTGNQHKTTTLHKPTCGHSAVLHCETTNLTWNLLTQTKLRLENVFYVSSSALKEVKWKGLGEIKHVG